MDYPMLNILWSVCIRQCSKGETVGDFINRYRLEHVARLLKTTEYRKI